MDGDTLKVSPLTTDDGKLTALERVKGRINAASDISSLKAALLDLHEIIAADVKQRAWDH